MVWAVVGNARISYVRIEWKLSHCEFESRCFYIWEWCFPRFAAIPNLISKSETASLLKKISDAWGIEFPKMKNVKVHQILSDAQIITGDGLKY